ncbi:Gfo/Idh/MocA family oxidoreductase [Paenibacillus rhizovicinus]|uniref:Gfo/Idh/MocA family oxidoreductase n=1 Tax=Paenibacillus rhizovicinus TaxID=2704463 RepID=A0A6C0PAU9_9BACL|nr:Gfo/Idh/MocA family oxidoreductase [Paenibacillus rhizovicinus]QHW34783.1 Gfo/Idh/MocA family oxidoreductase [Paenibacillus rhizovicinus]
MTKITKVGMLGLGSMGQKHVKNLLELPNVEVAAICGSTIDKAVAFSMEYTGGSARAYDSFDDMLDEEALDAVYICIPPFAHNGQVEKAASKGVAVFIEKPIAFDTTTAERMTAAVERAGVVSLVGYNYRFGGAVQELKRMIEDGRAGVPTLFEGRFYCNSLHSPWWSDRSRSGGQVFEQAIHIYDLALHFFGIPDRISGFTANLGHLETPGYTIEDTSVGSVRFRSGAMASICASNCAVPTEWDCTFTVICSKVTARFAHGNSAEFVFTDGETPVRQRYETHLDGHAEETRSFIAAVRGEGPEVCPIREGLLSLRLVENVMQSADDNGRQIAYVL